MKVIPGLSGLGKALEALAKAGITMKYDMVHKVLGEGNFVLVASEGKFGGKHTAFYDLFRVENGKIAEHWDTMEGIPEKKDWKNSNGKFWGDLIVDTSVPILQLDDYRKLIMLDQPFVPLRPEDGTDRLDELVTSLRAESPVTWGGAGLKTSHNQRLAARQELQGLLTLRRPLPLSDAFQTVLDSLLQDELERRGRVEPSSLPRMNEGIATAAYSQAPHCALWQGDITRLSADAIVNAANAELLGCFLPFHVCIDNAIHSAAGPRLRDDCCQIMRKQGRPEPIGHAKATRGYNLPSRYVLHTVGPVVEGRLESEHEASLAGCYRACLDLAVQLNGVRTVAFCAISTGVFGYPKVPAARVALWTVAQWLHRNPKALDLVVFNVFTDSDRAAYEEALS